MAVEFVTSINDYKLSDKQKVFALLFEEKIQQPFYCEKINKRPPKKQLNKINNLSLSRIDIPEIFLDKFPKQNQKLLKMQKLT